MISGEIARFEFCENNFVTHTPNSDKFRLDKNSIWLLWASRLLSDWPCENHVFFPSTVSQKVPYRPIVSHKKFASCTCSWNAERVRQLGLYGNLSYEEATDGFLMILSRFPPVSQKVLTLAW
jgi:hypothetical protein